MATYSEECAQWFTALRFDELPEDVVDATRLRLLDVIGLVLAACPTPLGRSVREAALAMGGGTGSRLGFGDRATPMCAALANGTLSQALEYHRAHRRDRRGTLPPAAPRALHRTRSLTRLRT